MPARFLLDEHISPLVASGCKRQGVDAISLSEAGLLGSDDITIFNRAFSEQRIVVTYNSADFARIFVDAVKEKQVPGIVFVNSKTFPTSDIKGLTNALVKLAKLINQGEADPSGGIYLTK